MTAGSPARLILSFAWPLILANVGQQLYMVVDASIVGRGVGVKALAAVGSTDWSYWLVLWTITGLTQGFSVFVARHFGHGDYGQMNRAIAVSAVLCAAIGAALTVAGLVAARPLLVLLDTPADILDGAETYLSTMFAGTLAVAAYNLAASILRAFGDGASPLHAMFMAAFVNLGLDLLFVLALGLGIFGAALASVIAQLASFAYCLWQISRIECVRIGKRELAPGQGTAKALLLFGLPIAVQYTVIAVSGMVLQSAVNGQGTAFVAGFTATNKLYGLLESTAIALGFAFSTFFAQNYGAGNKGRVRDGVKVGLKIAVALALAVAGLMAAFGGTLLLAFIDAAESEGAVAWQVAWHYLTVMSGCLVVLYAIHVYRNALQGLGVAKWSMFSGFAECAIRGLMATAAVSWAGREALFFTEPAAWLGALAFIMLPYYRCQGKMLP